LRSHGTELNQEVTRQVFGIDLASLFLPNADQRRLVLVIRASEPPINERRLTISIALSNAVDRGIPTATDIVKLHERIPRSCNHPLSRPCEPKH
jgi:hypothetical protein